MIQFSSHDIGEVRAELTSHDETVMIFSADADLKIFLGPSQAFILYSSLLECLQRVELDEMGLREEFIPVYEKIKVLQKASPEPITVGMQPQG